MKKKMLVSVSVIVLLAVVLFGVLHIIINMNTSDNEYITNDVVITGESYASTLQHRVIGIWDAIGCINTAGGDPFDYQGWTVEFTDTGQLHFFVDGIELTDRLSTFAFISENDVVITSLDGSERTATINLDNNDNILYLDDAMFGMLWTFEAR